MSPTACPPLLGRDAAIRRSIATGNNLVRQAQRRLDGARQQVLRADAIVRRIRVYLEQCDAREPDDATDDPLLTPALDDLSR
ncbi:MAG TPA: hypothetical protein VKE96_30310 [Vicinamibacterales bacterium]|nr:hypothetical protein [Vicinamibacterales bacterium]